MPGLEFRRQLHNLRHERQLLDKNKEQREDKLRQHFYVCEGASLYLPRQDLLLPLVSRIIPCASGFKRVA